MIDVAPATAAELDAIDAIERASFPVPWPRSAFAAELDRAWARLDVARIRLAGRAGRVVAFCSYWLVAAELHLLVIATEPAERGKGIAGALLAHVLAAGARAGCGLATLEVRRSNAAAIALYERAGFKTVHVRTGYYQDDGEDALVMLCELGGVSDTGR